MKSYFRKIIENMTGYIPGEQTGEKGVVKLNTNENPYPPSPRVLEQIRARLSERELALYPPPLSDPLRVVAQKTYGIPADWILVGNGSDELLNLIFRVFLDKEDRVLYPYPTYTLYRTLALLQEAHYQEIPFEEKYQLLPEELVQGEAKLKIICNPNSPTGTVVSISEVEKVLAASACPVVVDEAYVDFAEENCLSLLKKYPNLLILRTLSKSFALAGARVGFLFAWPEMTQGIIKAKDSYNVGIMPQIAAQAALEDIEYTRARVEQIKKTRSWFSSELAKMGFVVYPSQANFVWVQLPGSSLGFLYQGLKERNILVRYFSEWPDALRITIGREEDMKLLLEEMLEILK